MNIVSQFICGCEPSLKIPYIMISSDKHLCMLPQYNCLQSHDFSNEIMRKLHLLTCKSDQFREKCTLAPRKDQWGISNRLKCDSKDQRVKQSFLLVDCLLQHCGLQGRSIDRVRVLFRLEAAFLHDAKRHRQIFALLASISACKNAQILV